jgi:uncharacterized protein (TIGR00661 family)
VHTGGDALDLLPPRAKRFELHEREPLLPTPLASLRLLGRTAADTFRWQSQRPSLVVSDGDQAALLASRACAIPSIAVGHDLVFSGKVRLPAVPAAALGHQRVNGLPLLAARRSVAVHFLPVTSDDRDLRVARPETVAVEATRGEARDQIVCYFRDRNGQGIVMGLATLCRDVLWFGPEARSSECVYARAISAVSFRSALARAACVVGSAGSNLLAECVLLKKPVLALYRPSDAEQLLNAHMLEASGCGMACSFDEATPTVLRRFMARVRAGDFADVDLAAALPPVSVAVRAALVDSCFELGSSEAFA